jgi:hypothetical protein
MMGAAFWTGGEVVLEVHRIDAVISVLESYVLNEASLSKRQVKVALRLLDLMLDDELPPDGYEEEPVTTDDGLVVVYPRIAA